MVRFAAFLAVAALTLPGAPLRAQESDAEWLDDCRNDHDWNRDSRVRHCEIREVGLKGAVRGGPLTVDPGMNGGVDVEGWDRDSVAVSARIQVNARSEEAAAAIAREIRIEASGRVIRAVGPQPTGRRQSWSVSFVVMVPRRTDLSLATENGPLSVTDVTGKMDLSTQNGPLSLSGVAGDVRAHAQNGPLSVRLTGDRWEGTGLDAETKLIQDALATAPTPPPPDLVWRGVAGGPLATDTFLKQAHIGDVVTLDGFQSSTIRPEFVETWSHRAVFEIKPMVMNTHEKQ